MKGQERSVVIDGAVFWRSSAKMRLKDRQRKTASELNRKTVRIDVRVDKFSGKL